MRAWIESWEKVLLGNPVGASAAVFLVTSFVAGAAWWVASELDCVAERQRRVPSLPDGVFDQVFRARSARVGACAVLLIVVAATLVIGVTHAGVGLKLVMEGRLTARRVGVMAPVMSVGFAFLTMWRCVSAMRATRNK